MSKICIVGPSTRFLSGISYYTIRLANALSENSEVSVLYLRKLLPRSLFPGRNHVGKTLTSLALSDNIAAFDGMDYSSPSTWLQAYRFLESQKPDVLILQWWTSSVAHMHFILGVLYKKMLGIKVIIELHEVVDPLEEAIFPIRLYSRLMGRLITGSGDAFITHSEEDKQRISEKYRLDPARIFAVPLGLYDHHAPLNKLESRRVLKIVEENVLLFFGLIRTYKGVEYLIEAFNSLPEEIIEKSRLLIVGELWEGSDDVIKRIQTSRYRDKITLIAEYIPDDKVSLYFSAADSVILPYLRASQSAVAHIAMSFGKPVVVSEVGGLKESLVGYEGTFFVPPKAVDALKDGILNALQHRNTSFPRPEYNWSSIAQIYNEILNTLK